VTELTPPVAMPSDEALRLLGHGELTVEGRITSASNATLYCRVESDGAAAACVYKPIAGERPLWDFPDGTLAEREVATYRVANATGWNLVPPTVLRDGPFGPGMVQLWIAEDESFDVVSVINAANSPALQRIAVLDAVVNNSDRKVSHLLPVHRDDGPHHIYGVDHGVSFGVEGKLRTVLWQWAGGPISPDALAVLRRLSTDLEGDLGAALSALLTAAEVRATRNRIATLLSTGCFPLPPTDWPAVPYPPY
jgi:uncharacterized repeat protein (TIGR03843 family)